MDVPDFLSDPSVPSSPETHSRSQTSTLRPKRRSYLDGSMRTFKCGCGKDYMSYPALYTHIKQKHGGASPEGTDTPSIRGTRSRGRPRKQYCSISNRNNHLRDISFFHHEDLMGGPSNILSDYPGQDKEQDPLYAMLQRLKENPESLTINSTPCDEVFALYLMDWANRLKPEGYKLIVLFAQSLRDYLNAKGWEYDPESDFQPSDQPFCEVRPAAGIPDASNHFITEYFDAHCLHLDKQKIIEITLHFNSWLFAHRYSNLKISLVENE